MRRLRLTKLHVAVGCLLSIVALNAIGGGFYGLAGAAGVPQQWLEGSPFSDYFVPSLVLLIVVGGTHLVAGIASFSASVKARSLALFAAGVLLAWITTQVYVIGHVSFLQPLMAVTALAVIGLAHFLPRDRPAR
jgi:hypothetical protein